ncbi:hypothetical protein BDR26DRAFT_371725 [Obelidium mucronatum]|nr:hypothetical protein BDR26DRAFT_371725 [Obelidium mucronatum]
MRIIKKKKRKNAYGSVVNGEPWLSMGTIAATSAFVVVDRAAPAPDAKEFLDRMLAEEERAAARAWQRSGRIGIGMKTMGCDDVSVSSFCRDRRCRCGDGGASGIVSACFACCFSCGGVGMRSRFVNMNCDMLSEFCRKNYGKFQYFGSHTHEHCYHVGP